MFCIRAYGTVCCTLDRSSSCKEACLPKAVEVSGCIYIIILTVVGKASEAFFVGHTQRMLDRTMHRGVVF